MSDFWFHRAVPASVLKVTGEDAARFLQGQGSADVMGEPGLCRHTLWLDHRGRVRGDSHVLRRGGEDFLLVSHGTPAQVLCSRFDSFIVADDVEIEVLTDRVLVTVGADSLPSVPAMAGFPLPADGGFSTPGQAFHGFDESAGDPVFRIPRGAPDSVDCLLRPAAADAFVAWLRRNGARERPSADLEVMRIEKGIPRVPRDLGPNETPYEGGLGDRVCLTKGCFLGQEVVARQARLGRCPRFLARVRGGVKLDTNKVYPIFQGGSSAGELRSIAHAGSGFIGLALLRRATRKSDAPLRVGGDEGEVVEVL